MALIALWMEQSDLLDIRDVHVENPDSLAGEAGTLIGWLDLFWNISFVLINLDSLLVGVEEGSSFSKS